MNMVEKNNTIPLAKDLFTELKVRCDELNKLPNYDQLTYGEEIRYWFWRLDFYIWQHRKELFPEEDDALELCPDYGAPAM